MLTVVVDSFKHQYFGQSLGIFNYNSRSRGETRTMSAARSVTELFIVLVSEWLEGLEGLVPSYVYCYILHRRHHRH